MNRTHTPPTPQTPPDDPVREVENLLLDEEQRLRKRPGRLRLFRLILGLTLALGGQAIGFLNARETGIVLLFFLVWELGLLLRSRQTRSGEDQREP